MKICHDTPPADSLSGKIDPFGDITDQIGYAEDDPRIPIITIHQSKGLEFDVVFVAGASEGEIPSYYAVKESRIEEERRLFYVAITRAKRQLCISSFDRNDFGYSAGPSEFLSVLRHVSAC